MRKWMQIVALVIIFSGTIILLVLAQEQESETAMHPPDIQIEVQDGIALLTESEVQEELRMNRFYEEEMQKSELKIPAIEAFLKAMNEVKTAHVYTDIGSDWYVEVQTRRPVARIMLNNKDDFYLDNDYAIMDLSHYARPKTLAFTGLEGVFDEGVHYSEIINNDSLKTKYKLDEIYRISSYVCNDAFYNAQIVQVHYTADDGFIMIPRVGRQNIVFGEALSDEMVRQKFQKLSTFYDEVIPYEGWGKYKSINLKFENQIVAKKK